MQDNEGRLVLVNETARDLLGSIKAFWQSELGTLFNEFRQVTAVDSRAFPAQRAEPASRSTTASSARSLPPSPTRTATAWARSSSCAT